ncbi:MAG: hypothetical protein K8R99_03710 [Actinomycetia bacterium]|nr:hypothetical protein [Actinomycetes bacterium]
MPVAVTIRHVPDEVRNELASRAAQKGWSLQEFLLHELIELSHRPDRAAWIAQVRSRIPAGQTVTVEEILAARDADRR